MPMFPVRSRDRSASGENQACPWGDLRTQVAARNHSFVDTPASLPHTSLSAPATLSGQGLLPPQQLPASVAACAIHEAKYCGGHSQDGAPTCKASCIGNTKLTHLT